MITGSQIRAARELLGWRQAELAKRARIQAHSVESAESSLGQSFVPGQDMQAMRAVLEEFRSDRGAFQLSMGTGAAGGRIAPPGRIDETPYVPGRTALIRFP